MARIGDKENRVFDRVIGFASRGRVWPSPARSFRTGWWKSLSRCHLCSVSPLAYLTIRKSCPLRATAFEPTRSLATTSCTRLSTPPNAVFAFGVHTRSSRDGHTSVGQVRSSRILVWLSGSFTRPRTNGPKDILCFATLPSLPIRTRRIPLRCEAVFACLGHKQ